MLAVQSWSLARWRRCAKDVRFTLFMLFAPLISAALAGGDETPAALPPEEPDRLLMIDQAYQGRIRMPPLLREELESAGWTRISYVKWQELSPAILRQARAVVIDCLPMQLIVTDEDRALADLLVDYVRQGGGLLMTQRASQMPVGELMLPNLVACRFGTRILLEEVQSDPARTRSLGPWGPDQYTFTDRVFEPVKEGVRGVCYQSSVGTLSLYGVLPFLPDAPWRVVLSAGPKSKSVVNPIGLEEIDKEMRSAGFESDVPLAGVREFGKGRVAYVGMANYNIFARELGNEEGAKTYETYMTKGWQGCPSDQLTFYLNTLRWISAHADALAGTELRLASVKPVKRSTAWKLHRGVIGPRTIYSTGTSSPEEYVAKAKSLGLDFMVFLEDFAALKPSGFENLKADCRRLSTETFLVLPGFTYQNTDGNYEFVFSDSLQLPSAMLTDRTGKRMKATSRDESNPCTGLHYTYSLLGFENTAGWWNFSRNPYPSYDARNVDSMAVVTQEEGKIIDRDLSGYAINNRNSQALYPFALLLARSAAELEGASDGSCYVNIIGANGIQQIGKTLTSYDGRADIHLYPLVPPFGQTSITNGPVIELVMPRADVDSSSDLFHIELQRWPLALSVTTEKGLKEVKLIDGDAVVRRFLPQGQKAFSFKTSIAKERQKDLWVHAIDMRGREAISRAINCNSWILREYQCADRNNQLLSSFQKRPDGSLFLIAYGGTTATPDKGPWNGRIQPVGCFVFDKKLGVGAFPFDGGPEQHPQCGMNPYLVYDGKTPKNVGWLNQLVADREGAPHVRPHRVVASSEVLIGERVLDGVFPLSAEPVIHVWHSLYPVAPSQYLKTTGRVAFYLVKVDGVAFYLWDQSIELLQDVPTPASPASFFHVGNIGNNGGKERIVVSGQRVEQGDANPYPLRTYAFNRGDYVGFLKNPFGSLAVYSLTDGLVLSGDGVNFGVGIKPTAPVMKAGTKLRVRLLMAGMHRLVADPAALAARIRSDYGLLGAPSYSVEAQAGKVVDQQYVLTLAAAPEGCFRGRVRGLAALPGNLGCAVRGMNDRWTAWFQRQGKEIKTRTLPVEESTTYAVLRDDDEGQSLFIGHPIVADRSELVLNSARSEDGKRWLLEVHNPTDGMIQSEVSSSPHVKTVRFHETMRIEPGTSLLRELEPAQ
ncbi:MAG: hypothetical protein ABSF26_08130 [Thermoguttaceae bacterium]|jgi:hypothetical protein